MSEEAAASADTSATTGAAPDTTGAASSVSGTEQGNATASPPSAETGKARGADGKFTSKAASGDAAAADWRAGFDGEVKEFADRFASPTDLAKAALDFRKANASMVKLPGKDAKPEEVAKFRKAIGAGEKPEDYVGAFSKPAEGTQPTEADVKVKSKVAEVLHKHGAPVAMTAELESVVGAVAQEIEAEQNRVALKAREDSLASLRKEWGGDFDANKELAVRAIGQFASPGMRAWLNETDKHGQKYGDHPELVRAFGMVGRRMGEGEFIGAVGAEQRENLQSEYQKIMNDNPPGTDGYKRPDVQKRLQELGAALHGNGPARGRR